MRVERHLQPFRARLRLRRTLDWGVLGLAVGLAAATAIVVGVRLAGLPGSRYLLLLPVAALVIALAAALLRRVTAWNAAAAADGLGLAERVTSALHAARGAHPAAALIEAQALDGLMRVDPAAVRVRPNARRLKNLVLPATALVLAVLAPIPPLGDAAARAAHRAAIEEARATIDELAAELEPIAPEPAVRRITEELDALDQALAESKDIESAAQTIERAQERIASLAGGEQFAARRMLDALASAWAGDPQLGQLAQALRDRDADAIDAAVSAFEGDLRDLDVAERRDLQLDLQAAANVARDVPDLARALREAAVAAGDDEPGRGRGAELSAALGQAAGAAGSLAAVEGALGGLSWARAGLGAVGALAAGPAQGTGDAGAIGVGASGRGSGAAGSGGANAGESGGGGGHGGTGGSSGDGGSGAMSGSGGGAAGSGDGAGTAGAAPGTPGGADTPGRSGGAGGQGEAASTGALSYESIYAPSLLGGGEGVAGRTPGAALGADGQLVDLPESPLTLGALRPYNEVYGDYEASARQALARSPLPPNLEALVQAYFGAIRPADR